MAHQTEAFFQPTEEDWYPTVGGQVHVYVSESVGADAGSKIVISVRGADDHGMEKWFDAKETPYALVSLIAHSLPVPIRHDDLIAYGFTAT